MDVTKFIFHKATKTMSTQSRRVGVISKNMSFVPTFFPLQDAVTMQHTSYTYLDTIGHYLNPHIIRLKRFKSCRFAAFD